eukprot:Seg1961.5 transcript_id=Seg1961.5/GoldUCD/mRNA.D3Y31 product="hypothetical protein" protein_id=Seg1961.5/GoldUCD/D3Y31
MNSPKKLRNQRKLGIVEMLQGSNKSRRKLIESLQEKKETSSKGKLSSRDENSKRIQTSRKELKAPKLILPESNPARRSSFQNKRLLKAANGLKIKTQNGAELQKSSTKIQLHLSTNNIAKSGTSDVTSLTTDDVINDVKTSSKSFQRERTGSKNRTQNGVNLQKSSFAMSKNQLPLSTNSIAKSGTNDVTSLTTDDVINDVKTSSKSFQKERTGSKNRTQNGAELQKSSSVMWTNQLSLKSNDVAELVTDDVISLQTNDAIRYVKPSSKNDVTMPRAEGIMTTTETEGPLCNGVGKQNKVARNKSYAVANGHRLLIDDVTITNKASSDAMTRIGSNDVIISKKIKQTGYREIKQTEKGTYTNRDNEATPEQRSTVGHAGCKDRGIREENSREKRRRRWSYSLRQLMKRDNEVITSLKTRLLQRRISRPEPKPVYQEINPKSAKTLQDVEGELEKLQFNLRILRSEVANIKDGVEWILNGSTDHRDRDCLNQPRNRFQTM